MFQTDLKQNKPNINHPDIGLNDNRKHVCKVAICRPSRLRQPGQQNSLSCIASAIRASEFRLTLVTKSKKINAPAGSRTKSWLYI